MYEASIGVGQRSPCVRLPPTEKVIPNSTIVRIADNMFGMDIGQNQIDQTLLKRGWATLFPTAANVVSRWFIVRYFFE